MVNSEELIGSTIDEVSYKPMSLQPGSSVNRMGMCVSRFICLRIGTSSGLTGYCGETRGSI
jgi:hypothetical protein